MPAAIANQVVVITGASSGAGRETALRLARRGASVVLAARNEAALRDVAEHARALGGRAIVVVADVADSQHVDRIADEAVRAFGRIDTWVNGAAVSEYATIEQMTDDEFRRIVDVNLMGPVYGTRAALRQMRRQGGGTIINVGSVLSDLAVPLQSAYVATKHALRGFTDAVRMELEREDIGVNITLILPSSINTPLFDHARSRMSKAPRPIGPVYEPSVVADAIIYAARHRVRELYVGGYGKLVSVLKRISPRLVDWYMTRGDRMFRLQQDKHPSGGRDSLVSPVAHRGRARGRFGTRSRSKSIYTRYLDPHPSVKLALMGAFVVGVAAALVGIGRASKHGLSAPRRRPPLLKDPREPLIRDAYVPVVKGLLRAGINPRSVPGFERIQTDFMKRLETAGALAEADPRPRVRRAPAAPL